MHIISEFFFQIKEIFNQVMLNYCRCPVFWDRPPLFQVCHFTTAVMETAQLVIKQLKIFCCNQLKI